jgi:hypothetical protein
MSTPARYLLDSDDDGHWYLIPEMEHPAFGDWVYGEGQPMPDGVIPLNSHPNSVTFEEPQQFGTDLSGSA